MRHLASWASCHVHTARAAILLCYAAINLAGIWTALLLPSDTRIAAWIVLGALLLSGSAFMSATRPDRSMSFTGRKLRSIAFCAATLFFVAGNTSLQLQPQAVVPGSISAVYAAGMPGHTSVHRHLSIRERLLLAKHWFAGQSSGVKALLIIATVLVTLLLIYFWAAICCGIICDGLEALGYFLFFAGTAGAIFGCVRVIRRIVRGPGKRAG